MTRILRFVGVTLVAGCVLALLVRMVATGDEGWPIGAAVWAAAALVAGLDTWRVSKAA